jgi:hypothetical protein
VVVATEDVGDSHVDVVDDDAEVVTGDPSERRMMKSSRSSLRNGIGPFTQSWRTVSPSSGVRKRTV